MRRESVATKPKVLQVLESASAGAGKHVIDLLLHLDLERFDVSIAYSPLRIDAMFQRGLDHARQRGVSVFVSPMVRSISPGRDLAALRQLVGLIREHQFDIVHGHSSKGGFLARTAARLSGMPVKTAYTPHAISISINRAYWVLEKIAALSTDAMLAVSLSEYEELRQYRLVPESRLHCIRAAIDVDQIIAAAEAGRIDRTKLNVEPGTLLIGTVGRLAPQKDPLTLIRAAAVVRDRGVSAQFIWVGDGELKSDAQQEIERLGLGDTFQLLGYRSDVPQVLAGIDIFALASVYESFGYVTCEAMALAKPVVASAVTGTTELVQDGVTGLLFEPGNPQALADRIVYLAGDPTLRQRLGAAGHLRAKKEFDLPRMISEMEALYGEILHGRRAYSSPKSPGAVRSGKLPQT